MVSCKHCSTPNSLDSTFCKRCGTALPDEDVQAAQEKLTALIAEGNTAFNEGRTDEAMAVAESACLSNPSSVPALSLKALCHERRGELAEALECADQIVDLNPDSELDKIKRNQLRTKLSVSVQLATQPPDRRTALIGAVATVVLVLCIGIGAAKIMNRTDTGKSVAADAVKESAPLTVPQVSQQTNPGSNSQTTPPQQQPQQQPRVYDRSSESTGGRSLPYSDGSGVLPNTGNDPNAPEITLQGNIPVNPPLPKADPNDRDTGKIKSPTSVASTEKPTQGDDPPPKPDETKAAETNPGLVDIHISSGPRKTFGGGAENISNAGGAAALDKIGIQRYQLGSYGAAAASFEQALRSGGDQVTINQWLGRCYGNLGRKSDQVEAYKRCVSAAQAALAKGSGNKDRIHAILDTCQQELKVLQGN